MLKTTLSVMALMGAATAAQASVFDFNDAAIQDTLVSSVTTSDGLITADLTVSGGINQALVFDADGPFVPTNGATGDPDLRGNPAAGGILVVAENDPAVTGVPDDNATGGSITFDFVQAINLEGFTIYDDARVTVVSGGATFTEEVTQNGGFGSFLIGDDRFSNVSSLTFDFNGDSGGIDDILVSLAEVPLPAGAPLLMAGLGAFAIARRRKAAK